MELKTYATEQVEQAEHTVKDSIPNAESVAQVKPVAPVQAPVVQQAATPQVVPTVFAPNISAEVEMPKGIDKATQKADEIVSEVFGQAVVHTVSTDETVQQQLLETAKQVVQDKTSAIADKASAESTAQHFLKHEDACGYFGYDEKTTTKFHVNLMAAIIFVLNTIYICSIGLLVVAPLSFILSKLRVIIKKTWLAVIFAFIIYLLIVLSPWIVSQITGLTSGAQQ